MLESVIMEYLTRRARRSGPARRCGQRVGRPPSLTPQQQREARRRREGGEQIRDIARCYNVHNSTILRLDILMEPR